MVISLQYLRMPHESWATYKAVNYTQQGTARGAVEKTPGVFRPWVDELTAKFYSHVSNGTLGTATPLAEVQPDVHLISSGMRMNFSENDKLGQSRNTIAPDDFNVISTYVVGDDAGEPLNEITVDDQLGDIPQGYVDIHGEQVTRGYIQGYVVEFKSGAVEKGSGKVVIGNGQVHLVVQRDGADDVRTIFPIALISKAESDSNDLGRWRFDSDGVFVSSVGGTDAKFAFEFAVPAGYSPKHLYIKNVRADLGRVPSNEFASTRDRDRAKRTGAILRAPTGSATASAATIDRSESITVDPTNDASGVSVRNDMGVTLQVGNHGSLEIEEAGRANWVVFGEDVFSTEQTSVRILEQSLRIDNLAVEPDTVILKIDVSPEFPGSMISRAFATADPTAPPIVIDNLGNRFAAEGWTYKDRQRFNIRYTPGRPLDSVNEAPSISSARTDQQLQFIFRCNFGTQIESFLIGDKEILRFNPPVPLDRRQTPRR